MPQDAFTIKYVANELKALLLGGKISRIIQPASDELTFIIYTGKGNIKLEACLSAQSSRLSVSYDDKPVPKNAPNFCMLLRKHLQNAEITDIVQPDFERIIYFDFKCVSDFSSSYMRLYFELMGKYSNAVLCEDGIITGALKTTSIGENTKRILFSGVKYVPPEKQDKISPDDLATLEEALKYASGDLAKFLSDRVKGICFATAQDLINTYGQNITAQNIYDYIYNTIPSPCVTYIDGEPNDFKVRCSEGEKKSFESVLEAQSAYYSYVYAKRTFNSKKVKLESALNGGIKKLEKRLSGIENKLLECSDAESIKLKGELITSNIYAIERGMKTFEAVNYYDPEGGKIRIELDTSLSPSANAQKYYKRYAKLKRTAVNADAQKKETLERLEYLNSIRMHICAAETLVDLEETEEELLNLGLLKQAAEKAKKHAPPPYRIYYSEGFKIVAGRNNLQNDRLLKGLSPEDTWLHTQKYHSSHVGIISEGRAVPERVIKKAAEICAYFSDGKAGSKIPVDYTLKKFVKKPPKSNAGFVIYTDYKTLLVDPDPHTELASGND